MRTPRIAACTAPERINPQPLFVFFFSFVDSSKSSNIVLSSCRKALGNFRAGSSRSRRASLGLSEFSTGCGSGCCYDCSASAAPVIPSDDQRRRNSKTGVRSYQNSNHQRKGKSAQHLAAHKEQHQHGQESKSAGEDGARKSL